MGILAFIIVLILAAQDAYGDSATIALGKTAFNSDSTYAEIGYEVRDWEFNVGLIGAGETKDGWQSTVLTYGVSKIVRPNWCFLGGCNYFRIGVAGVHGSPLVGPINFRLGIGMDYGVFKVEAFHYSSAGIFEDNTGIDGVMLKLELPW
jgi:hypothetical protein